MSDDVEKFALARRSVLIAELKKIDAMLKAAGVAIPASISEPKSSGNNLTIHQKILSVLEDFPDGLRSVQVAEEVKKKFRYEMSIKHCRSALSTLKSQESITLNTETGVWRRK